MYRGHRVAVVMPVYNEGAHLKNALGGVPRFVDLIVVVDDCSTDDSRLTVEAMTDSRLVQLCHSENQGVGAATKTGYRHCLKSNADLIAVMDGDGQMDGRDLSRLLDRLISGADYVRGNRFLHKESLPAMPFDRYIGNIFFSSLTRIAAGVTGTLDAQCGYSAIRRQALAKLNLDLLYDRYGFPNEMFFAGRRAGLIIEDVPVRTIYGDEKSHINPLIVVPTIFALIARNFVRTRCLRMLQRGKPAPIAEPLRQASN